MAPVLNKKERENIYSTKNKNKSKIKKQETLSWQAKRMGKRN